MSNLNLDACAQLFLEAAYDPEKLGEALQTSANFFSGEAAQIVTLDTTGQIISSTSIGMDLAEAAKQSDYLDDSPRFQALNTLAEKDITYDYATLSHDAIQHHPLYQDYLKPLGVNWYAGSTLLRDEKRIIGFALLRGDRVGHYSKTELQQFQWLTKRASEASKLAVKLDGIKVKAKYELLESWSLPVAAITADCHILEMSNAFYTLLNVHNLGTLRADGQLKLNNPRIANALKSQSLVFLDAFTKYESRCDNHEIILRGSSGAWLGLHLHPIPPQTRWTHLGASALLTIREIKSSVLNAEKISATLGLTEAEGEVAAFLSDGITLRDVAKRRDTSYETTRWQLKSIYSKTGCATQSQLIVLIKNLFPNG